MGFFGGAVHPVGSGNFATIGGGSLNNAPGFSATAAGGYANTASGFAATIGGGRNNTASNYHATVAGGYLNNAPGDSATIGGGKNNTASGPLATIGGGQQNTASDYYATVGGGLSNNASGSLSTVGGGRSNTASNSYATVGGGAFNTASNFGATVGGFNGLASRYGQQAYSAGVFSAQGDAQSVEFILRNTTSGAATSVLFLDGSSTVLSIRNNTLLSGILTVSGLKSDGSQAALYQRSLAIKNIGGTTTLVSSSVIGTDYEDDPLWNLTVAANNTNDSLEISCTGAAGDNIRWVGVLRGLEIGMG